MEENSEKILFTTRTNDNREITVTNSRLIVPVGSTQKTYSVAHINSVFMAKPPRDENIWKTILGFAFFGILLFIMGSNSNDATMMFIGVALITISGAIFYITRPQHYVYISVVGEDTPTFGSHDIELIQNITKSVNKALIQR